MGWPGDCTMTRILIAEDEDGIARFIDKGLRAHGYQTHIVNDGLAALEHASSGAYDLLVLDVGLPRMDGFTVLRMLRTLDDPLPIIMCTARDEVEDTVAGFEGGADDYVAKPFRFEELLARIRTRIRDRQPEAPSTVLRGGPVALDLTTRIATVYDSVGEGHEVELSAREFALTKELLDHAGQVLSRDQLLARAWGMEFEGESNIVDVYVGYLRSKLGSDAIQTVRGVGYRMPS